MHLSTKSAVLGGALILATTWTGGMVAAAAPTTASLEALHPAMQQVLQIGSQSHWVSTLQADLNRLGYSAGPADGLFGPDTAAGLRAFEAANGLANQAATNPVVWQDILSGLGLTPKAINPLAMAAPSPLTTAQLEAMHPAMRQILQYGSRGHWTMTLQADLAELGYAQVGPADGLFGPRTQQALEAFQAQHGFPATGVTSAAVWQDILAGLGLMPRYTGIQGSQANNLNQGPASGSGTVNSTKPAPYTIKTTQTSTGSTIDGRPVLKVLHLIATAYGPSLQDNYPYGPVDAFGQPLQPGMVAVDPSVIPLKSWVYVTGYTDSVLPHGGFLGHAMDTGGAIKGLRLDIYLNANPQTVSNFGVEPVTVYVLGN